MRNESYANVQRQKEMCWNQGIGHHRRNDCVIKANLS